jgi:hypothetical protein
MRAGAHGQMASTGHHQGRAAGARGAPARWDANWRLISAQIYWRYLDRAFGRASMNEPITLHEILQAKITSFEETVGQLKGLAELKQSIADDKECPPEHPERFRQKAREHKRDAIGLLQAKNVLEIALAAKTKKEQIAVLRHYVLDFGQAASRQAKLSNSLADDDPRKAEADDEGFQASVVVSILNGILSDVAPEPPHYLSPTPTAHPTMAGRLGQVLSWTANFIALAIAGFFVLIAHNEPNNSGFILVVGACIAGVVWAAGRGLRYVLAGS